MCMYAALFMLRMSLVLQSKDGEPDSCSVEGQGPGGNRSVLLTVRRPHKITECPLFPHATSSPISFRYCGGELAQLVRVWDM